MYISCDVSKGGPAEPEARYVPNNPLFGLPLDSPQQECAVSCNGCLSCQGATPLPLPLVPISDIDYGSCFDTTTIIGDTSFAQGISQVSLNNYSNESNCTSNYWSPDEMASTFPCLSPLDIDPLPSLFQYSPCGTTYNFSTNQPPTSLSYVVHPHQMLLSPGNSNQSPSISQQPTHNNTLSSLGQIYYYDPAESCTSISSTSTTTTTTSPMATSTIINSCSSQHMSAVGPAAIYPSMSVNVSMNMTMHGYGPTTTESSMPIQYSQWTPTTNVPSSSVNVLYPPISISPNANHYTTNIPQPPFNTSNSHCLSMHGDQNSTNILPSISETINKNLMPIINEQHVENDKKDFYVNTVKETESDDFTLLTSLTKSPTLLNEICDTRSCISKAETASYSRTGSNILSTYDDDENSNEETSDNKLNICRLCGKTYARPSTLKTHLRTHSGERPYRCHSCNKSFSQAANLTAHVRTHTGQKPFRCPICDRRFSQSSSVTTHMRTHSGERPYRCSSCKKSFSDSSTLTKHLRIHSGEKPYQCKLCLLRFSQSGNLNRHMRVHATNSNTNCVT